jgi:hypothetical protein
MFNDSLSYFRFIIIKASPLKKIYIIINMQKERGEEKKTVKLTFHVAT